MKAEQFIVQNNGFTINFLKQCESMMANHLGLMKHEGCWKIMTMLFWVRRAPEEVDNSKYPEGYCTACQNKTESFLFGVCKACNLETGTV